MEREKTLEAREVAGAAQVAVESISVLIRIGLGAALDTREIREAREVVEDFAQELAATLNEEDQAEHFIANLELKPEEGYDLETEKSLLTKRALVHFVGDQLSWEVAAVPEDRLEQNGPERIHQLIAKPDDEPSVILATIEEVEGEHAGLDVYDTRLNQLDAEENGRVAEEVDEVKRYCPRCERSGDRWEDEPCNAEGHTINDVPTTASNVPEPVIPRCPQCDEPMVRRYRTGDGGRFWGCADFPTCRGVRNEAGA